MISFTKLKGINEASFEDMLENPKTNPKDNKAGVYILKGVADIFDIMAKMGIKKITKIINALTEVMNNANRYTEKITLGKENMKDTLLKQILGPLFSDKDYTEFVKIFRNITDKQQIRNLKKQEDKPLESIPIKPESRTGLQASWRNREVGKPYNLASSKDIISKKPNDGYSDGSIDFTDDFWMMLDKIDDKVAWAILEIDSNPEIPNKLGIEKIDVSDKDWSFDIYTKNNKRGKIKIGEFISAYFRNRFTKEEIFDFCEKYNRLKGGGKAKGDDVIIVPEFAFNPKDVRSTFISLVTQTYPHGTETKVLKYLPEDLIRDKHGNYYKIIGDSDIVFTCHLDTASRDETEITLVSLKKEGQDFITSDGTTILGADDKAGVTILLYMMAHNIPGVYYFFIGEERGGIGSSAVADDFKSFPFLHGKKKVVSFDRRNYYSVITAQYSVECCSDEFGQSLCDELNKSGLKLNLDPTGVFTDSANFVELIGECTNVSVGYFNEHTHDEIQNITYLTKLAEACVKVDWNALVLYRKVGFDEEVLKKWSSLVKDFKDMAFYNENTIKGSNGKILIEIEIDDDSFHNCYDDLASIEELLTKHDCNPDIKFDGNKIKIEIGDKIPTKKIKHNSDLYWQEPSYREDEDWISGPII